MSDYSHIGVIGHNGRLGQQLCFMGCMGLDCDISDDVSVGRVLYRMGDKIDTIINCAAKTKVDKAANDDYYQEAVKVNGDGIVNLATLWEGRIFHISTDYVFQGRYGPYSEDYDFPENDLPTVRMSYGISKMVGELNAQDYPNVHIIRTTGLYGGVSKKDDFVNLVLDTFSIGSLPIKVTKELRGNQTYIPHLVDALLVCAERKDIPKVLHIASKEVITRYEFAKMIADVFGLDKKKIEAVRNSEVPGWVEDRPKHGGLKVDLAQELGIPIYSISEGLNEYRNSYSSV